MTPPRPPWYGSTRRQRLPPDWATRRQRTLARDGHRCTWLDNTGQRCPHPATDVDHITPGDNHDDANLASLCAYHHRRKTASEGNAARRPRPTQRRPVPRHPGLLDG